MKYTVHNDMLIHVEIFLIKKLNFFSSAGKCILSKKCVIYNPTFNTMLLCICFAFMVEN